MNTPHTMNTKKNDGKSTGILKTEGKQEGIPILN